VLQDFNKRIRRRVRIIIKHCLSMGVWDLQSDRQSHELWIFRCAVS